MCTAASRAKLSSRGGPHVHRSRSYRGSGADGASPPDGRRAGWLGLGVVGLFLVTSVLAGAGLTTGRAAVGSRCSLSRRGSRHWARIAALVFAVRALRVGERSIALVLPLLLGALAVMFVVGEFAFPH